MPDASLMSSHRVGVPVPGGEGMSHASQRDAHRHAGVVSCSRPWGRSGEGPAGHQASCCPQVPAPAPRPAQAMPVGHGHAMPEEAGSVALSGWGRPCPAWPVWGSKCPQSGLGLLLLQKASQQMGHDVAFACLGLPRPCQLGGSPTHPVPHARHTSVPGPIHK